MARPQGGTALFDLLDESAVASRGASYDPNRGNVAAGVKEPGVDQSVAERPVVMGLSRPSRGAAPTAAGESRSHGARRRPWLVVEDDFAHVVLTTGRTAIVVFGLCAVLIGAFEWGTRRGNDAGFLRGYDAGRNSYAADTMSEIEAARLGAVSPGLIEGLTTGEAATVLSDFEQAVGREPSPDAGTSAWVPGHTYVVAQGFPTGRDADAEQAQAFLASRDIETVLVRFDSGAMQLITVQGFNRTDDAQRSLADQLLAEVHHVGTEYFASGGGYRLEGYFATFRGDRW